MATLEAAAQRAGAPLFLAPPIDAYAPPSSVAGGLTLGLAGDFQRENAALAVALARLFAVRCGPWLAAGGAADGARGTAALWAQQCSGAWAHEAMRWSPWAAGELPEAGPPAPKAQTQGAGAARAGTGPAGELTQAEVDGLAATRWPGRAQVRLCAVAPWRVCCARAAARSGGGRARAAARAAPVGSASARLVPHGPPSAAGVFARRSGRTPAGACANGMARAKRSSAAMLRTRCRAGSAHAAREADGARQGTTGMARKAR